MDTFSKAIEASRYACKDAVVPVVEIATIAQVRQALGSVTAIVSKLAPALKVEDVALLFKHRKQFLVLMPQIGAIYDAASRLLQARGATSTPTAGKLAKAAQDLRTMVVDIKTIVDVAAEFHELLSEAIPAIQHALKQPDPCMEALKQSVAILPDRIDILLNRTKTLPQFDKVSTELIEAASDLADSVVKRGQEVANDDDSELDLKPLKQRSPIRPRLAVFRGVSVRKSSALNLDEIRLKPLPLLGDDLEGKENPSPRKKRILDISSRVPKPSEIEKRKVVVRGLIPNYPIRPVPLSNNSRIFKPTPISRRKSRVSIMSPIHNTSNSSILRGMMLSTPGGLDTPIPARRMRLKKATSTPQFSISRRPTVSTPQPLAGRQPLAERQL